MVCGWIPCRAEDVRKRVAENKSKPKRAGAKNGKSPSALGPRGHLVALVPFAIFVQQTIIPAYKHNVDRIQKVEG